LAFHTYLLYHMLISFHSSPVEDLLLKYVLSAIDNDWHAISVRAIEQASLMPNFGLWAQQ
jgi:hypothetical protein